MDITREYIKKQICFYEDKIKSAQSAEEMKDCYWWLEYLNNFNWIK